MRVDVWILKEDSKYLDEMIVNSKIKDVEREELKEYLREHFNLKIRKKTKITKKLLTHILIFNFKGLLESLIPKWEYGIPPKRCPRCGKKPRKIPRKDLTHILICQTDKDVVTYLAKLFRMEFSEIFHAFILLVKIKIFLKNEEMFEKFKKWLDVKSKENLSFEPIPKIPFALKDKNM